MNRNLTGGYYLVSLDDVDLASESEIVLTDVAKLLYFAKKYKFVVFQDIVIDGEKKTAIPAMFEADMTLSTKPEDWDDETDGEFVPEELYTATIYNIYGKNIAIDADGGAIISTYLPTEVDPADLYGIFVRVINASDIDPSALTDEQIELLKNGVFVNGTLSGYKNPVFFPCSSGRGGFENWWYGLCILHKEDVSSNFLTHYYIRTDTKIIFINTDPSNCLDIKAQPSGADVVLSGGNALAIKSGGNISVEPTNDLLVRNKAIPAYPTDQTGKTYVLKLVNGTLTWVEETA